MIAKHPLISRLRHRRLGVVRRRQDILFVVAGRRERDVDLAHLEARHTKIDLAADLQHVRELQPQRVDVPARLLAQTIERQPQQSQLRLVEVRDDHGRNFAQADLASCQDQTPTGDHAVVGVHNDGYNEAKLLKAFAQFGICAGGCLRT